MEDADGTPFGRYRLIELLGRGGMGEVWPAFDTATERIVALKVLPTQYADDAIFQERFRREARSAAALDEPHVVPIHDFGEIDGRLFVTMRLIKGRDLHGILSAGRIDPMRAVGIIDQIASALHAAHQVNLVHRDVKPSNILVSDDDFAYLIDFGIARVMGQTSLTATSSVIGTWAYMAPERITAGQTDPRADTYALACVLYECLTGRQPFGGDSLEQQIGGHMTLPPPHASDHQADVPTELDAVIAKGMAKNPDDRYATTREMAHAARAAVPGPATGPNPVVPAISAAPFRNPYPNPDPQRTPQSGNVANYPVPPPSGPSPSDPTQHRPMPQPPSPAAPKTSRQGRLIAFASAGAVVAIVAVIAAIALSHSSGDQGSSRAPSTSATPSALPNTGLFTGTFTVDFGPQLSAAGNPQGGRPYKETWHLRSACGANGCIATATNDNDPLGARIFDYVDGRWLTVANKRAKCKIHDGEEWNIISVEPQPNGTLSGEFVIANSMECYATASVTFTRTADTDVALLPDPANQPPRVVSPAEALRGSYHSTATFSSGSRKYEADFAVHTYCMRTGQRCISYFRNSAEGGEADPLVFSNGTWLLEKDFDYTPGGRCGPDARAHTHATREFPLPQPLQDPITTLIGYGHGAVTGLSCVDQQFDTGQKYERRGD